MSSTSRSKSDQNGQLSTQHKLIVNAKNLWPEESVIAEILPRASNKASALMISATFSHNANSPFQPVHTRQADMKT